MNPYYELNVLYLNIRPGGRKLFCPAKLGFSRNWSGQKYLVPQNVFVQVKFFYPAMAGPSVPSQPALNIHNK